MNLLERIFGLFKINKREKENIHKEEENKGKIEIEIDSLWNYIHALQNTQAYYLIETINFEEWTTMDEIRDKIKLYYGAEFKNQKSLYPYLKTLVDIGFIETNNIDGKKKWKKKEILLKIAKKKKEVEEIEAKSD